MVVHSFHLAEPGAITSIAALLRPPRPTKTAGLRRAECMIPMELGASVLSPGRWRVGRLAMFAAWEDEAAIDRFLAGDGLGAAFRGGWHLRLAFVRRWGRVREFDDLPAQTGPTDLDAPVVAVTLARLRLREALRFVRWGKPVERLVRDHPGATFALAAARPWRTLSTFSAWRTAQDMVDMVRGRNALPDGQHHCTAMAERVRKDFHLEFTTLRFTCISEHGAWRGRDSLLRDSTPNTPSA